MPAEKGNKRTILLIIGGAVILLAAAVTLIFAAAQAGSIKGKLVGIALPTKTLTRYSSDPELSLWKRELEEMGCKIDLKYADNRQDVQNEQIEKMIEEGCDVLVIAPIDCGEMRHVLEQAKEAGIPVIAYDKLLTGTDKCDYCVTFDNYAVGKMQGQYIADKLGISAGAKGPFTLEFFAGDPDDNNAQLYYEGAMEVLRPYIDSGALVVKSGETGISEIAIRNWSSEGAMERTDSLLEEFYSGGNIDVVLSPNDSIAQGIVASLKNHGYGSRTLPFPILTGQDCDKINIGQIIRGEQSMSILKDKRVIIYQAVKMAEAVLSGKLVPVNAVYNNGTIGVPSYNCDIKIVDADNWREVLIDTGYYREDDIPME